MYSTIFWEMDSHGRNICSALIKEWLQRLHSIHCSAAFSSTDNTISLYDDGELKNNENFCMDLPCIQSNVRIGIECHPKKRNYYILVVIQLFIYIFF